MQHGHNERIMHEALHHPALTPARVQSYHYVKTNISAESPRPRQEEAGGHVMRPALNDLRWLPAVSLPQYTTAATSATHIRIRWENTEWLRSKYIRKITKCTSFTSDSYSHLPIAQNTLSQDTQGYLHACIPCIRVPPIETAGAKALLGSSPIVARRHRWFRLAKNVLDKGDTHLVVQPRWCRSTQEDNERSGLQFGGTLKPR